MAKEKLYTVKLTAKELWEAMNLISASFEPGPGNEVAESLSQKLSEAHRKVPAR